ncbi:IS5 family transposase [Microcoleus sp. herbarium2]|uniref:IS5 family transposase n=1 Tax=Microcoleus sp. herbarium2 TaxID=3055433 RepID=UPI002FD6821F
MYRPASKATPQQGEFKLPFQGKLSAQNRWVILSELIPWSEFEGEYAQLFSAEMGAPAKSFRMALGALIIKEKLGISDRETVEQIKENPYLQYFIGLEEYSEDPPFEASMLVHFRQRIQVNLVKRVNQRVVQKNQERISEVTQENSTEEKKVSEQKNRGKLILDATCAPADITYPTDLKILNAAREKTESIIDILHSEKSDSLKKKPRTYRRLARKDYLAVAKQRRPTRKVKRKAMRKQLQYIKRNLGSISELIAGGAKLSSLNKTQYKSLLVIAEVYRQQQWMWSNKKQSIPDRIVSITQPHIRPIVRGKAGTAVEFGAKLSASCVDGYIFLDRISWDNFNESVDLKAQVEAYKEFTGFYPESVHVDKIYRTKENRAWCKERGIRMSGPPLGRPRLDVSKEVKKQASEDEKIRNAIEGKFGQGKRRFSIGRVMAKLPDTAQTAIAITFLVMNLSRILRQIIWAFFCQFFPNVTFRGGKIKKSNRWVNERKKKLITPGYFIS